MKISLKLPLALAAAMALLLASALFGVVTLRQSLITYETTVAEIIDHERRVNDIGLRFKTQVQEWKNTLLRGRNPQALDKHWAAFQKTEGEVRGRTQSLLQHLPAGDGRKELEAFLAAHERMGQGYRKGHAAFVAAGFDPTVGDTVVAGVDRDASERLVKAADHIEALSKSVGQAAAAQGQTAVLVSLGVMAAVFAAGIVGALMFSRSITRPLQRAVGAAQGVAGGDLTLVMDVRGKDETADLLRALDAMRDSLARVVSGVRANAEGVATASSQIAHGNLDLGRRTEQQASALQETAASMEQLGATVRQNADHARQASELAQEATAVGAKGGQVVGQVVATMKDIQHSSSRIADIIGTIDGIAFQTNILALNAAVEAARAGEQGRGFAVVASEVRSLAQRSSAAAREIKSLIQDSVGRVQQGAQLVDQAGTTMAEVVASIQNVSAVVAEISTASAEQSAGVGQVGQAMSQIDQATQQNAALVEEGTAAAESLRHQAAALVRAVAVFRTAERVNP